MSREYDNDAYGSVVTTTRLAIEMHEAEINKKMEFIENVERELEKLIEMDIVRWMGEYKGKFGGFTRHDIWLWDNCRLARNILFNGAEIMDAEED